MDIQITRICFTEEESQRALPLVVGVIAGATPSFTEAPEPANGSSVDESSISPAGNLAALPVPDDDLPDGEEEFDSSSPSVDREEQSAFPVDAPIAPPTGNASRARAMVWDKKKNQFVQRTRTLQFLHAIARVRASLSRVVESHPNKTVIVVGCGLGTVLLIVLIWTGVADRLYAALNLLMTTEVVVPERSPAASSEASSQIKEPVTPSEDVVLPQLPASGDPLPAPGDASSKSGLHGEKPPMQSGALEDN